MKRRSFLKKTAIANMGMIAVPTLLASGKIPVKSHYKQERIKIGQIGICHSHAPGRLNTLKKMSDIYEIVGVVDDRDTAGARVEGYNLKPYEGLKWMTEEELFRTPGLQAVLVTASNTGLVPTAIRCMKQNLAIHMEKPGGEDLILFDKLLEGCEERNLPFQMGYMFRNNPAMQFCQKAIRKNWLGDIFEIQADMSTDNRRYGDGVYQRYLSHFKGGAMFVLGCHHIDIIVSMLGRPQEVTPFLGSTKGSVCGAKNNCLAVIEYPNATASVSVCDLKVKGNSQRRFKINGTKGSIEFSPLERFDGKPLLLQLTLLEGNEEYSKGSHTVDCGIKRDRYEEQFLELAKMIRGETKNPYTREHEYLTQEVILAASGYTKWKK